MWEWLVVGGGPCGTFAVAKLLQRGAKRIGWVDAASFETMGRLGSYGSVPANTRNDRLIKAFRSLPHLEFDQRQAQRSGPALSRTDPMLTATLQHSVDALQDGSLALRSHDAVEALSGRVRALRGDVIGWEAEIAMTGAVTQTRRAQRVLLCVGAAPRAPPPPLVKGLRAARIPLLDHDAVVTPERFESEGLSLSLRGKRVAIVGAAHSGLLAARNLIESGAAAVELYGRGASVVFAEERGDWIKYDGTGLKGDVAAWARHALREGVVRYSECERGSAADENLAEIVASSPAAVAFTAGFDRSGASLALPWVTWRGEKNQTIHLATAPHDGRIGRLTRGLHGSGIAFPEFWTDPEGHTEPRVGFVLHYLAHLERIFDAAESETATGTEDMDHCA